MRQDDARAVHEEADRLIRGMYSGLLPWTAREQKRNAAFATVRDNINATAVLPLAAYAVLIAATVYFRFTRDERISQDVMTLGGLGLLGAVLGCCSWLSPDLSCSA
jgi:hypothetical protein